MQARDAAEQLALELGGAAVRLRITDTSGPASAKGLGWVATGPRRRRCSTYCATQRPAASPLSAELVDVDFATVTKSECPSSLRIVDLVSGQEVEWPPLANESLGPTPIVEAPILALAGRRAITGLERQRRDIRRQ
jgi:hypothetical protein